MSERTSTGEDIRGLFGRDSLYVALWAVQLGMAALFTPLSTRLLGAGRFGFAASCMAVMQVLFAVAGLTLQTAIQREYAASGERAARRLITLAVLIALLAFALADSTGPLWSSALGLGPYPAPVRYAVIWACATAVSNAGLGLLRSRDQLGAFATVSLLQSVVAEGLGLLLVVAVRRSAGEYLLGQLLAQAAAVTVALLVARPLALRRRDRPLVARTLRYSIPLLPAALAVFVLESSDRLVLQGQLGSTAVARYAIAYNIGSIPILLLGVLNNVWMPRMFALGDDSARGAVLAQSRDALYALLIPVLVGLGIGAPLLLAVWAPPSYRPAGLLGVVAIVLATAIPCSGASAHTRSLLAAGRTRPVAVATLLAAAVNLGLNLALVPVAGISGSALATLVSYGVYHAGLARPASRSVSLPWPSRALMAELGLAVAVIFGAAQLPATLPWLALRLLVAAACCAAFAAILLGLARVRRRRPSAVGAWIRSRTGVVTAG